MPLSEFGTDFVWWPDPTVTENSNLQRFMRRYGYKSLPEMSPQTFAEVARFWDAVLEDLNIQFYQPYSHVVDFSRGIEWPAWCQNGQMNIVHNCLDKWLEAPGDFGRRTAVRWEGEEGATRVLTYAELGAEVNRVANALRGLGCGKGSAVGLFMGMSPEIVIALLAIAKIGGILVPLFSGYGAGAVASRLSDAGAVALFTADGFYHHNKYVPLKETADQALAQTPDVRHVIVVRRTGHPTPMTPDRDHWWHDIVARQSAQAETEHTSAEDPVMLIYTSGTTGRPKGTVHTHCGFPIKAAQDLAHGFDVKPGDAIFWITDMGWMMGPWLVFGTLLLGATMVIYDGTFDYPSVDRLWEMVERHGVTGLGVSPTLIRTLKPNGPEPVHRHDLSTLRWFGSTGSPWDPESWRWLFEVAGGSRLPILNYSGGTEISGGILMGNLLTPLKPAAFSGPAPGMAADVVDTNGEPLRKAVGELVIRMPWIGMTRGFWHDPERYLQTYWSRFPGVWVHGDWAAIDGDGQWYIAGRSDDTIKVSGRRVGPAEIESVLMSHPAVTLAAAIGVPEPVKGEEIVCFCCLAPGCTADEDLRAELMRRVIAQLGKPLAPREIKFVTTLPRTRNAKVMHRIIRAAYLGGEPGDVTSLENPAAVDAIRNAV
ncbi:MAG TPA: AMP-binding protein [Anaerolineae bacterium]